MIFGSVIQSYSKIYQLQDLPSYCKLRNPLLPPNVTGLAMRMGKLASSANGSKSSPAMDRAIFRAIAACDMKPLNCRRGRLFQTAESMGRVL